MADNKQIAADVLAAVGGKENVKSVLHCMTRLRFNLVDESIVNDDEVKAVNGALGVAKQGGQYQVIIGTNVPEVYKELTEMAGIGAEEAVDENLDEAEAPKGKLTPKEIGNNILNYLSGSVVPLIPVLVGGALFKTLEAIFGPTLLNLVPADSPFVFLCEMVYNAAFYFMPIIAGFAAAQKLGINGFLGVTVISALWPLLVMTGMHVGMAAIALADYAQTGQDTMLLLAATVQAFTVSGVALAVWLRMKDPEQKTLAFGYFVTQFIGGVGEPLLYGVFLRYKRPWIASIAGGAAAGLYAALTGVILYTPVQGIFSPLSFLGGDQMNMVNGCIAIALGMIVAFVVAWFTALTPAQMEGKE